MSQEIQEIKDYTKRWQDTRNKYNNGISPKDFYPTEYPDYLNPAVNPQRLKHKIKRDLKLQRWFDYHK